MVNSIFPYQIFWFERQTKGKSSTRLYGIESIFLNSLGAMSDTEVILAENEKPAACRLSLREGARLS